jgi:hypothetical protein
MGLKAVRCLGCLKEEDLRTLVFRGKLTRNINLLGKPSADSKTDLKNIKSEKHQQIHHFILYTSA